MQSAIGAYACMETGLSVRPRSPAPSVYQCLSDNDLGVLILARLIPYNLALAAEPNACQDKYSQTLEPSPPQWHTDTRTWLIQKHTVQMVLHSSFPYVCIAIHIKRLLEHSWPKKIGTSTLNQFEDISVD
jgi:hypothetical protein